MGYILPVTKFEYTDYQRRVSKHQQNSHHIEKPYKVFLDMQQKSDYDRKYQEEVSKNKPHIADELANPLEQTKVDPSYLKLTGKGTLFNASV